MAHWIVNERHEPASGSWELSVIDEHAEEADHMKRSTGWAGEFKIIVWSFGGPCGYTVNDASLAEKLRQVAREYADELNAKIPW